MVIIHVTIVPCEYWLGRMNLLLAFSFIISLLLSIIKIWLKFLNIQLSMGQIVLEPKIVPGMLVLLKEDNQPSLKWKLGRITDVHPGKDGIVRVVTVKTTNSSFKRDTQKICILPTEDEVFK